MYYKLVVYGYFILITISCFLFYRFITTKSKQFDIPTRNLFRDNIKTGDILLLDWQKTNNIFLASFFRTSFMHPGIAIWENGDLYIVELINYFNDNKYRGLIKIPFNKWYRINKRSIILHNPLLIKNESNGDREILRDKILSFYRKYSPKIKRPSGFGLDWTRFLFPPNKYQEITEFNKILCTEVIASLLAETGVTKKTKSIQSFTPDSFIGMRDFDMKKPYNYGKHSLVRIKES